MRKLLAALGISVALLLATATASSAQESTPVAQDSGNDDDSGDSGLLGLLGLAGLAGLAGLKKRNDNRRNDR